MTKGSPIVSVICLSHNHEDYVQEALYSVMKQDYGNVELIIVDDGSSDGTVLQINHFLKKHPEVPFIQNVSSRGNCKAFNQGYRQAKGEFIIDLAADDVLLPSRISKGVAALQALGEQYGVNYCNPHFIDEKGNPINRTVHAKKITKTSGDLYVELIKHFIISAPTMLIRRSVLDVMGGYDEKLAYEDFDFWIRSSRNCLYAYTDEYLVNKRIHPKNYSSKQYWFNSPQMRTTYQVCQKIYALNRSEREFIALKKRLRYEMKKCIQFLDLSLLQKYFSLYLKTLTTIRAIKST